jgi:hypothetical protein
MTFQQMSVNFQSNVAFPMQNLLVDAYNSYILSNVLVIYLLFSTDLIV